MSNGHQAMSRAMMESVGMHSKAACPSPSSGASLIRNASFDRWAGECVAMARLACAAQEQAALDGPLAGAIPCVMCSRAHVVLGRACLQLCSSEQNRRLLWASVQRSMEWGLLLTVELVLLLQDIV